MTKKNTKKALAMAAAAAAVTGGTMAVTGNVHADTVNTQDNTQNQTQNPQASDLKTQQDASRQAYADAKQANTDAQSDLTQASAKNTDAQGNVDSAQTDVDTATQKVQSATTAEQNTQAEVTQAQTEANKAQNNYNNAVKQQAQTDQAVQQAQNDLKTANQDVSEAQKVADQANAKQAQAQTNANTANQNVENTNAHVQKTQGDVNDAQASVKNAENDVQTAQNHDQVVAQDQSDVQAKTDAKNKADAKVNDAQKVNNEKIEAQSNAQTAVNNAQKTVDQLRKDVSAQPIKESITVNPEWINLVKSIQERLMSPSNNTDMDFTTEEGQEWYKLAAQLRKQNKYVSDPTQAAIPVHINSDGTLSKDDQTDATQFYLSILNPIRKAIGMPELKISNQSLQMGDKIAKQYNDDNWVIFPYTIQHVGSFDMVGLNTNDPHYGNHDLNAINNNHASCENAGTVPNSTITVYNNADDPTSGIKSLSYNTNWATNRDELHKAMFDDAVYMVLENSHNPGHAKNALGLHSASLDKGNNFASIQTDKFGQIHFNVESETVKDTSTEIPVETGSKTDDHAAQLASAKQALQDAQAKLETAKQEARQASADLASAKADAKTAADELKAAQDKLAHDSGSSMSLADAQEALKNAKAVLAQKQVNIADAKKAAQKAQTMKIQSDSALASAKQQAQTAQKALADAQAKAKSAQEHVDALTSNDQAVADAKDNLNAANQKLQVAKSNHETAQDNLTKAQNELKQAQTKLENAKDEATKAANALKNAQMKANKTKDALAKAKDNLITDSKVYGDSVAIKDQTIHAGEINKIVDPEIANPMAKDPTQSLVMGAFLQMATSKLDTIPTGTTAKWNQPQNVSRDANLVGEHSEDVLVTFPDGSTTTVKMSLHVLAATKPSQPDTPVVNPGHDQTTTPTDPTDQPGHNVKPSTEPSTTPSHEEQQPGTHTDTPTAKPNNQQPSTQPSGDEGQTKADHKVTLNNDRDATVAPSADHEANSAQTVVTNGDNNVTVKPSDQQPSTQPSGDQAQTKADHKSTLNNDRDATVAPSADHEANSAQTVVTNGDNNITAKPSDQQPSTQPSGDQGQTKADHKATSNSDRDVTVTPSADHEANGTQTVVTNGDNNITAKPSDQQPSTQPSGDEGQTMADHKATLNNDRDATVAPSADHETNGAQTVVTNGDNNVTAKPSDQQPSTQPSGDEGQTMADHKATLNNDRDATVAPSADHEANGAQTVVTNGDDNVTAKPSDQQPSTQQSGNQGQSQTATPDHKATVNDNNNVTVAPNADHEADGAQTVVTNGNNSATVKPVANGVENSSITKRSDLNNGKLPQTGNADEMGLVGLSLATMASLFGIAGIRRKY